MAMHTRPSSPWRRRLAALAALLALVTPESLLAFKVQFHEQITEQELASRGFDTDSADEVGDSNYYTDFAEATSDAAHADNNMLDAASARLRSKRTEIGDALNRCERRSALDRLGEALHTVQDIYSHSNSIDNGIPIPDLLGLARGTAACSLPNFAPGGLVTGYFSLGGIATGNQCRGIPANMCCHLDLNKDAPGEANGARHPAALAAARGATNTYLDLLEADIRARFGEPKATQLIKLLERKQRTVYFVIDDTGSMGADIAGVKATVNSFLNQIIAGDEAPTLGLASFKDSVNDRGISCDIEALRAQVNALFASGGGDCPEASNSALLAALSHFPTLGTDMQLRGGRVLLATDASAGDSSLGPVVAVQSAIKGVSIDAILTGDCVAEEALALPTAPDLGEGEVDLTTRDRTLATRVTDPLTSPSARTQLRALTEQTGGVLFNVSRVEVDDVIPTLLELSRPDVAVVFTRRAGIVAGTPYLAQVPIDDTLSQQVTFMVTAATSGALPGVTVRRPDGTAVASGDPGVVIRNLSSVRTITVATPGVGPWQVEVAGQGTFNLRVFGATPFQLNSVRLQQEAPDLLRPELDLAPIDGQPFVGDELVADFRFTGNPQTVEVSLRRPDGTLLAELDPITPLDARRFRAELTIPAETFLVETTGLTAGGTAFVRQVVLPAVPQTVALEAVPETATASPGSDASLSLQVRNAGAVEATFRLLADLELAWPIAGPDFVTVPAGGSVEVPVSVTVPAGTAEGTTNTVTLFAEDMANPRVRNSASVMVIAGPTNQAPDCSAATASPNSLWPPNHSLQPIAISGIIDPDGDTVSLTVSGITQDEPVNGSGDGNTSPDGTGVGTATPSVRAERSGGGNGRVYEIQFSADDGNGGSCTGAVEVAVPHSRNSIAIHSGQLYDSTASSP